MFPSDINRIIAEYASDWALRDWVNEKKLVFSHLCANPHIWAVRKILEKLERVGFSAFLVDLLFEGENEMLSANSHPYIAEFLLAHQEIINWYYISRNSNPKIVDFLVDNMSIFRCYCCNYLHENDSDIITSIMISKYGYTDNILSNSNPMAVEYCIQRGTYRQGCKKTAEFLSSNRHDSAIEFLKKNVDNINWYEFSKNSHPWAIEMLGKNIDKVDWEQLSTNPGIFRETCDDIFLILDNDQPQQRSLCVVL